jgi:hypothetical protein
MDPWTRWRTPRAFANPLKTFQHLPCATSGIEHPERRSGSQRGDNLGNQIEAPAEPPVLRFVPEVFLIKRWIHSRLLAMLLGMRSARRWLGSQERFPLTLPVKDTVICTHGKGWLSYPAAAKAMPSQRRLSRRLGRGAGEGLGVGGWGSGGGQESGVGSQGSVWGLGAGGWGGFELRALSFEPRIIRRGGTGGLLRRQESGVGVRGAISH